jgi:hypothetical protein
MKKEIYAGISLIFMLLTTSCSPSLVQTALQTTLLGGGGGGGGSSWKTIASEFKVAFTDISSGLILVLEGIKASEEAIGIKEKAAVQELEELKKASGGGKVGSAAIKKATTYVEESSIRLAKALENKVLTAEEKKKLMEASQKYFKGAVISVPGYIKVMVNSQNVLKAGIPNPMDLIAVSADIPTIIDNAPAMITMIPTTFKAIKIYKKSLEKADIQVEISDDDLEIKI